MERTGPSLTGLEPAYIVGPSDAASPSFTAFPFYSTTKTRPTNQLHGLSSDKSDNWLVVIFLFEKKKLLLLLNWIEFISLNFLKNGNYSSLINTNF